ncbi:MAG: SOS response-associated peptidase [Ruminococcaceae bacterium]|nr:SOS response-associated peptidase [Oscillospiraceae bacterium]
MCGRYYIDQEEDLAEMRQILEEVNRRFQNTAVLDAVRTGEIAPSHIVPVLRLHTDDKPRVVADLLQWGFPGFKGRSLLINARAETAADKPTFRSAVKQGRVLIPANAFFEWTHDTAGRTGRKMKLYMNDEPTFYMAGLARYFPEVAGIDPPIARFVILTTAANTSVAPIHNRMPLIIPRRDLRAWLSNEQEAQSLLYKPVQQLLEAKAAG